MPKEARFLTGRAARTRHSQDRQEDLQSQDAECCRQQDAGLGMVLPPHVPSPEARLPPSCSSVSPQAAEGAPGEGVTPGGRSDPPLQPQGAWGPALVLPLTH